MKIPKSSIQFALYFLVGAGATAVEWVVFYLLNGLLGMHYAVSTTLAFAVSTLANWSGGRILLFHKGDARGLLHELISIYTVSILGLLANLLIMWITIEKMYIQDMLSKMIATGIVFIGNFLVRKFWIYKI